MWWIRRSTTVGWTSTKSSEAPGRWGSGRGHRESPSKPAGKLVSFDTEDSHGLGGGSVVGYAVIGGRYAPFLGMALSTSHKHLSILSWQSSDTTSIDFMTIIWSVVYVYWGCYPQFCTINIIFFEIYIKKWFFSFTYFTMCTLMRMFSFL